MPEQDGVAVAFPAKREHGREAGRVPAPVAPVLAAIAVRVQRGGSRSDVDPHLLPLLFFVVVVVHISELDDGPRAERLAPEEVHDPGQEPEQEDDAHGDGHRLLGR